MLEQDIEYPHRETLLARAHNQGDYGSKRNHNNSGNGSNKLC
jgi:hypothetical protein